MSSTDSAPAPQPATSPKPSIDTPASLSTSANPEPAPNVVPTSTKEKGEAQPTPATTTTTSSSASQTGSEGSDESDEEPQNALTKKFTEQEWAALKEFRKLLPEIFESAYDDKPDAKTTAIILWGVTIDPNGRKDAKASVILMKWLRARNLNPTEAKTMMIATLRWREQFKVQEAIDETYPKDVFGKLGHVYGRDKEGRPITYNLYGANKDLKGVFGDVQRFLRWRVQLMERGIEQIDFENVDQMVQVHDYEGVGFSSRDANSKNAASEASSIFQNHYPEFLARKFFVNVPSFLTWIFWLFKPVLSAQTLAKMKVVGSGPHVIGKELLPLVDEKELPDRYGGVVTDAW